METNYWPQGALAANAAGDSRRAGTSRPLFLNDHIAFLDHFALLSAILFLGSRSPLSGPYKINDML
jgi:hypothetical protein